MPRAYRGESNAALKARDTIEPMRWGALLAGATLGSVGCMTYAVRGKSSQAFGPSIYRGDRRRRAIALTFDDGPSESTPLLLRALEAHAARATFFQCGANVRRLPEVARAVSAAGHEIGNHSDTHPYFYFQSAAFIRDEFRRAQDSIGQVLQVTPAYYRAPYGVRWPGFRDMQRELRLTGAMWSVMARDWKLAVDQIVRRVLEHAGNGAIVCLHDGRAMHVKPDVSAMLTAIEALVPALLDRGFCFETLTEMMCPMTN